ncbi:MAG: hypothetical protein IKL00_05830 [Oscillospiraceae bacterium]|nr:hypothetical protein [Oscillospiraceae bacterium]
MSQKYSLDRETYRAVKKMDRAQMEQMLTNVYVSGKNDAESACIDFDELRTAIGQIMGIGESRLNEIMDVIQRFMENTEN